MSPSVPRKKLTLTISENVKQKAIEAAAEKDIPISRLVENFLEFFINPSVYCFKCGEKFNSNDSKLCPKCGWMICPKCGICRCGLNEETAIAVFHMRRVYENLLSGRVKQS
jgi:hypothetical protein